MSIFSRGIFVSLSFLALLTSKFAHSRHSLRADFPSALLHSRRHEKLVEKTFQAVRRVVDFYAKEYRNFNIDGIFGLQALDGILEDLVTKARANRVQTSNEILQLIAKLHTKAALAATKAQPFLNASDPDYYRLGFVARHAWHFKREFRSLNTSLSQGIPRPHENQKPDFDMKTSDQCISDLIGDQRSGAKPCNITDKCWKFVRRKNTLGYMTTHQALYFMVGELKGCLPVIKKKLLGSHGKREETIEDIYESLCANIYKEVTWNERVLDRQQRSRDAGEKDVYMEQCYICGILGYHKFLSFDRLSVILGWQLQPGCYGINENPADEEKENGDKIEKEWNDSESAGQNNDVVSTGTSRPKNLEKQEMGQLTSKLPGGCVRHNTGVATGLLGVYLKWLLTFEPSLGPVLM